MSKKHWRDIENSSIAFDIKDIRNKLIPVLQRNYIPGTKFKEIKMWADKLTSECKIAFGSVLPFEENEIEFLTMLEEGNIKPELLSKDELFCHSVSNHPALNWRVKQNK